MAQQQTTDTAGTGRSPQHTAALTRSNQVIEAYRAALKAQPDNFITPEDAAHLAGSMAQVCEARSYRCSYHPKDLNGYPVVEDSGVLPYIQLKASNAEHAQRAAFAVTGCVVAGVERMEAGVV